MPHHRTPSSRVAASVAAPFSGARQASLREANLRLVLRTIYEAATPPSRADVAAVTGMTRSTVSRLVDDLVKGSFVAELDPPAMSGPGRPATPLVPCAGSIAALGLQINAGFLAAVVVDLTGRVLAQRKERGDFVGSDPAQVLPQLGDLGREVLAQIGPDIRTAGVGLALPGIVASDTGRLLRAPNLGWSEVAVAELLGPLSARGLGQSPTATVVTATVVTGTAATGTDVTAAPVTGTAVTGRPDAPPGPRGSVDDLGAAEPDDADTDGDTSHGPTDTGADSPVDRADAAADPRHRLSVRIHNEADYAAWAVAHLGPGRAGELRDFVYLTGEIGIGGAVVVDGHVMTGRHGWAGELGHVCVNPGGPTCRCGSTGCLEQYVGGVALRARAGAGRQATDETTDEATDDATDETADDAATDPRQTTIDASIRLVARARAGDEDARAVLDEATRAIGIALGGVVNVLDIPTIVLGGHLAVLGAEIGDDLADLLASRVLSARWAPPRIVLAHDEVEEAGALGAAMRELDHVLTDPARWLP